MTYRRRGGSRSSGWYIDEVMTTAIFVYGTRDARTTCERMVSSHFDDRGRTNSNGTLASSGWYWDRRAQNDVTGTQRRTLRVQRADGSGRGDHTRRMLQSNVGDHAGALERMGFVADDVGGCK